MPDFICKDCKNTYRDKWDLERHLNRKYPCNSVVIGSKEKVEVRKINSITEEELKEQPKKELKYKMKMKLNGEKQKLEKEE